MGRQAPSPTDAERLIYSRTDAGNAELGARAQPMSSSARRLLILTDGRRTVGMLSRLVRSGEFDAIVDELRVLQLIEPTGTAESPDEAIWQARLGAEHLALIAAKQRLHGLFEGEFGIDGQVWDARIADCVNLDVLRRVLREAVDVIYFRKGEAEARRIVVAVRPIFERKRPGPL